MKTELKKAIVNFIFDNEKNFQLHNATTDKFRPYIFDATGNYLIGGKAVSIFVGEIIKILKN